MTIMPNTTTMMMTTTTTIRPFWRRAAGEKVMVGGKFGVHHWLLRPTRRATVQQPLRRWLGGGSPIKTATPRPFGHLLTWPGSPAIWALRRSSSSVSSSSASATSTTSTSTSTSGGPAPWWSSSWWRSFRGSLLARTLRFARIIVVVGSVYALGYQRGLIDYGVDPVSVENSMLRSVLLPTAVNVLDDGTEGEDGEAREDPLPWYARVMFASDPHPDKFYVWQQVGGGAAALTTLQQQQRQQQQEDPRYQARLQREKQRQEEREYAMMQLFTRTGRRLISTAKKFTHQKLMDIRAERYRELLLLKQGNVTDAVKELVKHKKRTDVSDWSSHVESLLLPTKKAKTDLNFTEMLPPAATSDGPSSSSSSSSAWWRLGDWFGGGGGSAGSAKDAFGIHWSDTNQVTEEELEQVLQVDPEYEEWSAAYVRIHGRPFAPHLGLSSAAADQAPSSPPWKYILIDSPMSNAFVSEMVPRTIFVTTGLLDQCIANQHEMALILGHELSHLILGHVSLSNNVEFVLRVMETLLLAIDPTEGVVSALCVMGLLATCRSLIGLSFSRDCEREADELGLKLAALSCYDTQKGAQVMYKMLLQETGELSGKQISALSSPAVAVTALTDSNEGAKNVATTTTRAKTEPPKQSNMLSLMRTHPPTAERYAYLKKAAAEEENYHKYATDADHPHGSGCVATRKTLLQLLASASSKSSS